MSSRQITHSMGEYIGLNTLRVTVLLTLDLKHI